MEQNRPFSKKVFFLYPHSVVQDQMLSVLMQAEYEVAILQDHQKASQILYRFPNSIMFINIEAELKEEQWEQYIRSIMSTRERHNTLIGILSYNPTPELAQKYLMDIGIQCGFVGLKLGFAESTKIILKTLEANEAKGGRKFVRVKCPSNKTSMNFQLGTNLHKAEILDISSAGFSFTSPVELKQGQDLPDVQLVLWGAPIKVAAKIAGVRAGTDTDARTVYVGMFDSATDRATVGKIYTFIRKVIQAEVDAAT